MATIWEIVLCLPYPSAANTTFFDAASRRNPVIASSRATMITTIQAGIHFKSTNAMNEAREGQLVRQIHVAAAGCPLPEWSSRNIGRLWTAGAKRSDDPALALSEERVILP